MKRTAWTGYQGILAAQKPFDEHKSWYPNIINVN